MMRLRLVLPIAALALAAALGAAALWGHDDKPRKATPPTSGNPGALMAPSAKITGEGMTIEEALVAETPENLLIRGYLIREGDGLRLCSGLDGGTCVTPAITIEGEPGIEPGSPEPVTVLGALEGHKLVAVNLAAA
jgi:hypothetical protein